MTICLCAVGARQHHQPWERITTFNMCICEMRLWPRLPDGIKTLSKIDRHLWKWKQYLFRHTISSPLEGRWKLWAQNCASIRFLFRVLPLAAFGKSFHFLPHCREEGWGLHTTSLVLFQISLQLCVLLVTLDLIFNKYLNLRRLFRCLWKNPAVTSHSCWSQELDPHQEVRMGSWQLHRFLLLHWLFIAWW